MWKLEGCVGIVDRWIERIYKFYPYVYICTNKYNRTFKLEKIGEVNPKTKKEA